MSETIRQAKLYDVPAISRIEEDSFASPWSAAEITKDVTSKDGNIYVAVIESDGETAGYAEMRTVAGEAQIYNIVIDKAFRGRGLGEMLLRHLIDKAKDGGCRMMTLEVRGGNEAAMELYRKLGFREVGRRPGYYAKGGEDAVLMDLALGEFEITVGDIDIVANGKFLTLGIETSCDETAASVVADGRFVMSNVISSQIDIHTQYGGVVPEIASRKHLECINDVIAKALIDADVKASDIDLIGVTYGPGLVGALLIGVAAAKAMAYSCDIPLIGVNHMHGHIAANYLEHHDLEPPFMALIVSGGHTEIVNVPEYNRCEKLGGTRDDAAGEAFDKVARVIGLGYPGGPKIDKAAKEGDPDAIAFKRVYLEAGSLDFSFSGLKTQALNYLNSEKQAGREINVNDVAASFQEAVTEVIADKAVDAAVRYSQKRIVMAGGVASNSRLRYLMETKAGEHGIEVLKPSPVLCTDNGAMIASAAYYEYGTGRRTELDLDAVPGLEF